jgi:hypothetical protein
MAGDNDVPGEPTSIGEMDPRDVQIETIDAYHLGGRRYSASFELTNSRAEFSRSYLLDIEFGDTIAFEVRLIIEDKINSHLVHGPDRQTVLELGGIVHDLGPEGDSSTSLSNGVLRRLWMDASGRQFAFGDRGVVYMRDSGGWEELDGYDLAVFRDLDGTSRGEVYACGHGGLLARLDGRRWIPLDLPDQRNFWALEVETDNSIYLGGPEGLALALTDGELIELSAEPWNYFGIHSFKGRRFWSDANYGISVQEGNRIVPFRKLGQGFYMHSSAEKLVVSGWKEVFVFDGENWSGFELGYDGNIFLSVLDMADYGG